MAGWVHERDRRGLRVLSVLLPVVGGVLVVNAIGCCRLIFPCCFLFRNFYFFCSFFRFFLILLLFSSLLAPRSVHCWQLWLLAALLQERQTQLMSGNGGLLDLLVSSNTGLRDKQIVREHRIISCSLADKFVLPFTMAVCVCVSVLLD